jgi:hypothetical protein
MNIYTKGPGRYCENHVHDGCDKKSRNHDSGLPQRDLRIVTIRAAIHWEVSWNPVLGIVSPYWPSPPDSEN